MGALLIPEEHTAPPRKAQLMPLLAQRCSLVATASHQCLNSRVFPLTDYCGADSQDEIIAWRGLDCMLYFPHESLAEQAMDRLRSPLPGRQEWELGLDQEMILC